ncbi:hypothetical protein PoB_000235400 [Plakobranchus ocellatus]|uniref:Uncharacterized protein n=1 Tax=Plakobranchus ocellatus TaxID=259542 RepID=A0AAV3Y1K0_9GAST|nr:hypothetical protein PoB_000235400 [Plakobranchus ocellatus]
MISGRGWWGSNPLQKGPCRSQGGLVSHCATNDPNIPIASAPQGDLRLQALRQARAPVERLEPTIDDPHRSQDGFAIYCVIVAPIGVETPKRKMSMATITSCFSQSGRN